MYLFPSVFASVLRYVLPVEIGHDLTIRLSQLGRILVHDALSLSSFRILFKPQRVTSHSSTVSGHLPESVSHLRMGKS